MEACSADTLIDHPDLSPRIASDPPTKQQTNAMIIDGNVAAVLLLLQHQVIKYRRIHKPARSPCRLANTHLNIQLMPP
jgi:hypothetical protein